MAVHQIYAQIFEEEIKNIIVCDDYSMANYLAKATYGDTAFAVEVTQYPVAIGDKYHDNRFWKVDPNTGEETQIFPLPTLEQDVSTNTHDISLNRSFTMEVFELLRTLTNTSSVVFTENNRIVFMYGMKYMNNNYDVNLIPNIGNLRTIILQIYGTGPASN